jgi:Esterase-like activity of phytase
MRSGSRILGRILGRRRFLSGAAGLLAAACTGTRPDPPPPRTAVALGNEPRRPGGPEVWSFFDLPAADPRSRELSGAAWDAKERVLWAVQDENPSIVSLVPDRELRTWKFGETIDLECRAPVDLEGLVIVPEGFIVCSEDGPRVIEVDRKGHFVREMTLPPRFADARNNKSLESLTVSPSGRYLFTTTEVALRHDGGRATMQSGTRVRILRMDRTNGEVTQHTYVTDPVPYEVGDWGVADLAALDDTQLFVLERGWSKGYGNTVRVYETELDDRASCSLVEHLSASSPMLGKTLRVDLATLPAAGLPKPKQPQPSALLDNYEGMAIGPRLPNGRPSLFLVSDDNGHINQVARILVLGL